MANTNLDATAPFVATHDGRGDGHNLHGGRNDHGRGPDRDGDGHHDDDNGAGYNFVARAAGYGHVRFRIDDLRPGENRVVTIEFPRNVASAAAGATASGDGTGQANLIDETEGTQWTSTGTTDVAGRQVLITLAGKQTFRFVKVSALLGPGQNRFTALRSFELFACDASKGATCDPASPANWKRVLTSQGNAFPSVNPRPIAPDMIMRGWRVPTTSATHVLFRGAHEPVLRSDVLPGRAGQRSHLLDRLPRHLVDVDRGGRSAGPEHRCPGRRGRVARLSRPRSRARMTRTSATTITATITTSGFVARSESLRGPATAPSLSSWRLFLDAAERAQQRERARQPRRQLCVPFDLDRLPP